MKLVASLMPGRNELVLKLWGQGRSCREVAGELGISQHVVAGIVNRAVNKLGRGEVTIAMAIWLDKRALRDGLPAAPGECVLGDGI